MDATAEMSMEDNGDGSTTLIYHVDIAFTGRLATLGARIVKRKINSDIGLFFDNLRSRAES
jgi:carbon monoxide dehydrogenase subunit G